MMLRCLLTTALVAVYLQDPPARQPSGVEHVVQEVDYPVETRRFDPPIDIRADHDDASAEASLVACQSLRAMVEGRFDDWLNLWDDASKTWIRARTQSSVDGFPRRTAEQWRQAWRGLEGKDTILVAEGTCPTFTVFAFEIRNDDASTPPGQRGLGMTFDATGVLRGRVTVARQADGTWKRTRDFDAHPVVLTWFTDEPVIRMPAQPTDWEAPRPPASRAR